MSTSRPRFRRLSLSIVALCAAASAAAAQRAWEWSGSYGDDAVELLILGDIQIQGRDDPASAFVHLRETLAAADLVYANLEGTLVRSRGKGVDIPDKGEWIHPGPEGARGLKASNIHVVGVANNVAYGGEDILETLRVLEANGVAHVGAGKDIEQAHRPAIVERKGVRIGFLQYTARWYREDEQIATAAAPGVARILSRDGIRIDAGDRARLRDDVRALRPRVDVVVVSHHNRDGGTPAQFGPPPEGTRPRRDRTLAEQYQKEFAHAAIDDGADLVFGHGTHTVQGVEVYEGKPILYAIGHSAFDQPGYETSTDGLVVRGVIVGKRLVRVSFVPVTRDEDNDVLLLDPSEGEGDRLVRIVKRVSGDVPLAIVGKEVVLIDRPAPSTENES